ncbi:MAG: cephalosporin hydroxylase [Verrucomicrobia bacterium]|nr:MAG: cephalosporin hydroxylase [Verrucomicrobiota bacterium]
MDPAQQFKQEQSDRITALGEDAALKELSRQWVEETMRRQYVYNFSWLGRPIIQYPQDIMGLQELVWATRPDLIIETGIAHGGSLILSASLLALLDMSDAIADKRSFDPSQSQRKVLGIDIDIRPHNQAAIQAHPMASRIQMIQGSSIAEEVTAQVREIAKPYQRVMVCLDSMHTHHHVLAELEAYAPMVTKDCYCVVLDTFVEDMPESFFADRPWNVGNNPKTAIWEYLKTHPEFVVDKSVENKLLITVAPDGFLKRVAL